MDMRFIPADLRPKKDKELRQEYEALLKEAIERDDQVAAKILRRYLSELAA